MGSEVESDSVEAPVRVLHLVPSLSSGGIESLVLTLWENIDRTSFAFDIAALNPNDPVHQSRFEQLGAPVHFIAHAGVGSSPWSKIRWRVEAVLNFRALIVSNQYDVLHCHLGGSHTPFTVLAWTRGIKVRIVHSHQAGSVNDGFFGALLRRVRSVVGLECLVTHRVGCGESATLWLWGRSAIVRRRAFTMYNGIDISKYERSRQIRDARPKDKSGRANLLHVGRFSRVKNQVFLLEVFSKVLEHIPLAHLNIVGFGPLEGMLKEHVSLLRLDDHVTFFGQEEDVADLLSSTDCFLLPSLSEGLPIVAVESQVAGVPIVVSDSVTREIDMGLALFLPLEQGVQIWAECVVDIIKGKNVQSYLLSESLERFDIRRIASLWARLYSSS